MSPEPFRRCNMCGQAWASWEAFLHDPQISLIGLQAVPKVPAASVLVFNHARCGSISVRTAKLRPLVGIDDNSLTEVEACDGCFRDLDDLARCDKPCAIAADRRLALEVRRRKG